MNSTPITEEMRDLAIQLWTKHKMSPEQLAEYESIKHITADDVLNFEKKS